MTCLECGKPATSVWPLYDLKVDVHNEPRVCGDCYRKLRSWAPHPAFEESN